MRTHFERERLIWHSTVSSSEKLILLCLNSFVDGHGSCFPSVERIALMCSMSDRTVRRTINDLIGKHIVFKNKRRKDGRQTSNLYSVDFDQIPQKPIQIAAGQNGSLENSAGNDVSLAAGQNDSLEAHSLTQCHPHSLTNCPEQPDTVSPYLSSELSNKDLSSKECDRARADDAIPVNVEVVEERKPEQPKEAIATPQTPDEPEPVKQKKPRTSRKGKDSGDGSTEEFLDFQEIYNQDKPAMWAAMTVMNASRKKVFAELVKVVGSREDAKQVFSNALAYARSQPWFNSKDLDFENFVSKGKIVGLHERWISRPTTKQGHAMTEGDARMVTNYQRRAEWFLNNDKEVNGQ